MLLSVKSKGKKRQDSSEAYNEASKNIFSFYKISCTTRYLENIFVTSFARIEFQNKLEPMILIHYIYLFRLSEHVILGILLSSIKTFSVSITI